MTATDPTNFLPYLLSIAAEKSGENFQRYYKDRYGMLRTEWRVLFHLGCYGDMQASEISRRAHLHKTKISRAVTALGRKRLLQRQVDPQDRRRENLRLTVAGHTVFVDLLEAARRFDASLTAPFSVAEADALRAALRRIIAG